MIKILVIRLSSMGDVIMQTSLINSLKQAYSYKVIIDFLTLDSFKDLLENNSSINLIHSIERRKGFSGIYYLYIKSKEFGGYDLIIDLHATNRSNLLRKFLFKTPHIVVDKRSLERQLLVKFKINFLKKNNEVYPQVKRLLDDFKFYFNLSALNPETFSKYSENKNRDNKFGKYLVLAPSASFENKRWSILNFKKLAESILEDERFLSYKIILLAGSEDNFCQEMDSIKDQRFINLQGKTSLDETSRIVANSLGVVGNDSGIGHIANSCNVPLIVIFGPTSEYFGFGPYKKNSRFISANLDCSPCSTTGSKPCKFDTLRCMDAISSETVYNKLIEVMSHA